MAETTYRANCHCGKFVYEWTAPEPLSTAMTCNCSICTKKAYVFAFAAPGGIKVVKGSIDDLTTYMFGGTYAHKVCLLSETPLKSQLRLTAVSSAATAARPCFARPPRAWA